MPRDLTARQLQVAELVASGRTTHEIANDLKISYGTAKQYVWRIFERLDIRNRAQLTRWWMERERRNGR